MEEFPKTCYYCKFRQRIRYPKPKLECTLYGTTIQKDQSCCSEWVCRWPKLIRAFIKK